MSDPAPVKFRRLPSDYPRRYEVILDGEVIGTVQSVERRYNLRRVYVFRGWNATKANGERLYNVGHGATASTRREAAQVLARATAEPE